MFLNISRKRIPLIFKLTLGLSASVILLLFSIGFSYRVADQLYHNNILVENTDQTLAQLDQLVLNLNDCESSVKAYVLANNTDFLNNYSNARKAAKESLLILEAYLHDTPEHQAKMERLRSYLNKRFRLLEKAIDIKQGKSLDKQGERTRINEALRLRANIELLTNQLKIELDETLSIRKEASQVLLRNNQLASRVSVFSGCLLAILLGIVVIKDVREREKTEGQLRLLNQQKSQFFSVISHDLRGPTRNTAILLDMMQDPTYCTSPADANKMAAMARDAAHQTHKLVEDLLVWGRLQMDGVGVVISNFKPHELVEKVREAMLPSAELKSIKLENQIPQNLVIGADANMVETVMRNLISNAIKFTPEKGQVRLVAKQSGNFVELIVEDTGVGMNDETMQKLFSIHTKHTTKGTAGEPGTGLGLAVCREFVERNGGTIGVESRVGEGSKFNVRLPAAQLQEQE